MSSPRKERVVEEAERAGAKLSGTGREEEVVGARMAPLLKAAEKLPLGEGASR